MQRAMSNEFALGFVAVFGTPVTASTTRAFVASWLDRYEQVEQVLGQEVATVKLGEPSDLLDDENPTFRVVNGPQYAWVYVTHGARVVETTGTPNGEEVSLSLELLTELPGVERIVPTSDERKMEALEQEGLL